MRAFFRRKLKTFYPVEPEAHPTWVEQANLVFPFELTILYCQIFPHVHTEFKIFQIDLVYRQP